MYMESSYPLFVKCVYDGKENRNLCGKKVKLEECVTQLLSLNQSEWICKYTNKWINKIIISSGTFSSTATSTEDNDNNNNDNDDDDDDDDDYVYTVSVQITSYNLRTWEPVGWFVLFQIRKSFECEPHQDSSLCFQDGQIILLGLS